MRLDKDSRRLRFAHAVSDAFIEDYASRMSEYGSLVYGHVVDGKVRGAAELRRLGDGWGEEAEAAFSVEKAYQDNGVGSDLMGRVVRAARNRRVRRLYMSCLAENAKMQVIAKKHEAVLRFEYGEVIGEILPEHARLFLDGGRGGRGPRRLHDRRARPAEPHGAGGVERTPVIPECAPAHIRDPESNCRLETVAAGSRLARWRSLAGMTAQPFFLSFFAALSSGLASSPAGTSAAAASASRRWAWPTQSSFSMRPPSDSVSSTLAMSSSEKLAICSNLMTPMPLSRPASSGVEALDLGQVIGLALRLLEALEGGVEPLGARVGALEDAGRFAAAAAQIIKLGAAHLAAAQHLDLGDVGRVDGKHALHALAVGNLADREALVDAAAGAGDDDALVGLQAEARALGLVGLGRLLLRFRDRPRALRTP